MNDTNNNDNDNRFDSSRLVSPCLAAPRLAMPGMHAYLLWENRFKWVTLERAWLLRLPSPGSAPFVGSLSQLIGALLLVTWVRPDQDGKTTLLRLPGPALPPCMGSLSRPGRPARGRAVAAPGPARICTGQWYCSKGCHLSSGFATGNPQWITQWQFPMDFQFCKIWCVRDVDIIHIYIYIYTEREREIYTYIYI